MENRQLQPHEPQDLVDFRSEAEQNIGKVAIFFVASVPLAAATQLLQLGMPGLVISAAVVAVFAMGGKHMLKIVKFIPGGQQLVAQIPVIHWNRLIGTPDADEREQIGDRRVVDADPSPASHPGQGEHPQGERQDERQNDNNQEPHDQDTQADNPSPETFQAPQGAPTHPHVRRLTIDEIVSHSGRNNYKAFIGRSFTKEKHPAIQISFYKRHIKIIGASQYGKSSMVAALLEVITRTHDPEHVLIALLDLENRTSKLFENIPHRAVVSIDGKQIILHARSKEQVLEYLGYLVQIMEERYKLTVEEVKREPIILMYLEEFIDLKDHFKSLSRTSKEARQDYEDLVHRIKVLARRGLKVYMQFVMCAQVDYRDEDLQEALININSGLSFCVRATAAGAAGFRDTELLNRNVAENKIGLAVMDMPECKDLLVSPDYALEDRLLALESSQRRPGTSPRPRSSMLSAAGTQTDLDAAPQVQETEIIAEHDAPEVTSMVSGQYAPLTQNPNIRKLTTLHRKVLEHYQPSLSYRELGELIGTGKDKAGELLNDLRKWEFLPPKEEK